MFTVSVEVNEKDVVMRIFTAALGVASYLAVISGGSLVSTPAAADTASQTYVACNQYDGPAGYGLRRLLIDEKGGVLARVPIETILDYLAQPERFQSSHGLMYLTDLYVSPAFGDPRREALAPDASFPLARGNAVAGWTSIYAGPAGTFSPFHQDVFSTHTWLAQVLRDNDRIRGIAVDDVEYIRRIAT